MDTPPDLNSDPLEEDDDAEGNESGCDLSSDQAQDGGQGEGGADRAGENAHGARHRKAAEKKTKDARVKGIGFDPNLGASKNGRKSKEQKADEKAAADIIVGELINGFTAKKDLSRRLNSKFKELLAKRKELYKCDALDALHDIAMMPITSNALMNQVKFLAAQLLAGPLNEPGMSMPAEGASTLRQLNDEFAKSAQRIRSVRERVIEFEQPMQIINGG